MNLKLAMCVLSIFIITANISPYQVHAADYTIIDLGTLGGTFSAGESINNYGHVTGSSKLNGDAETHAFLYDGSSMLDLGILSVTDINSYGNGINDSGQVTGFSAAVNYYQNDTDYKAFIYDNGNMQNLNELLPMTCNLRSKGYDINNSGQSTGYCAYSVDDIWDTEEVHTFFYDGSTMHELSTLGSYSKGYAINNSGHITGVTHVFPDYHAFLYNGKAMLDLGTLGGSSSHGQDINDSGQVTGGSWTEDNEYHAFFYDGMDMHDLGTLGGEYSYGHGINNYGHVVGRSELVNDNEYTAYLYDGTTMHDLCELTDCKNNGWTSLSMAKSINDRGDITGSGEINGETHAFLILSGNQPTPAVLPAVVLLLIL